MAAMDVLKLRAQLELASSFAARRELVTEAAQTATPADLKQIARFLNHKIEAVRLGAIEIFELARFRPVLTILAQASRKRRGEERVFAARAVAAMAQPEDRDQLEPFASAWLASSDEFLKLHATNLLVALGLPRPEASEHDRAETSLVASDDAGNSTSTDAAATTLGSGVSSPDRQIRRRAIEQALTHPAAARLFCAGLIDSKHPGVRVDLIGGLERLGPKLFAKAAQMLLKGGDSDVVALVARALAGHISSLSEDAMAALGDNLRQARRNHAKHTLACAAIDDCLLEVEADRALDDLAARIDQVDIGTVRRVAERLGALTPERRAPTLPILLEALSRAPRRALLFAELLRTSWPTMRPPRRRELTKILAQAGQASFPRGLDADALIAIAALYKTVLKPGEKAPEALLEALDRRDEPAVAIAAIDIHLALATEAAAHRLVAYLDEPAAAVRDAALRALADFDAPYIDVTVGDDGSATVTPSYRTASGQVLDATRPGVLITDTGERYVLDRSGDPVAEADTEWGGCGCCERPRALERSGHNRPSCPITGERHVRDGERNQVEREHALGGCGVCESIDALVRMGALVRCPACQAEHIREDGGYQPVRRRKSRARAGDGERRAAPGSSAAASLSKSDLPSPPGPDELKLVEPSIARAMAANVFLLGGVRDRAWSGSGVIVAREGSQLAILTNRHVVEDSDGRHAVIADMHAYTISGELVPAQVHWRASFSVDLALITISLERPERVSVIELQEGPCLVGSRLFAIGNPMGLSWSYSSGTLSAFRTAQTEEGVDIRRIQSHVPISHGSSGGGLYHEQGHLVGINHGGITAPGGDQNFAIAMPTVLAALAREKVSFAGKPLLEASAPA